MQISDYVRALFPVLVLSLSACVGDGSVSSSSVVPSSSASAASSSVAVVNAMPEVRFTSPMNGHNFDQGRNALAITAAASDNDGDLASVSLYIDDVLSSSLTQSPFSWPANVLNSLDAGNYTLRLVAEDERGAKSSDTITVTANATVNSAPSLEFTFPLDGDVLPFRSSVDVTVDASDGDGQITSVLLLLNNQRLATLSNPPFKWPSLLLPALQDLDAGLYTLRAVATDNRGATAAQEVTFEVLLRNDFPTVSFVAPAENLRLPIGSSLDILANAADTDGNIEEVILSINDQVIGSDYNPPFEWFNRVSPMHLQNLSAGTYVLELTAFDDKGGRAKASRTVEISNSASLSAGDPVRGEHFYQRSCVACHGSFGEGTIDGPQIIPAQESYSHNGQNYSLYKFIDEVMPVGYEAGCVDQCARNVATYIKSGLTEKYQAYTALEGDAVTGKMEYALHCADCHGERGTGGVEDVPLFPLKENNGYMLKTYYAYSAIDLFGMIDIGMPVGPRGYPEGYADNCSGQCAADVVAYLPELEASLTASELKTLQIASGENYYANYCAGCHGEDGSERGLIPLSDAQKNNTGLDSNDLLYRYNRDAMPPSDPSVCDGRCAEDVTVYIREVLD